VGQPDLINGNDRSCQVWLNPTSRDDFHKILRRYLEEFLITKEDNPVQPPSTVNEKQEKSKVFLEELSKYENEPFYRNDDPFECIVCTDAIEKGDGILLYNCLHPFCKPCVIQMIQTSTEPTIKCPHNNCDKPLEERELRGVRIDYRYVENLEKISSYFRLSLI
jgi:hypothetical protein